MKIFDEVNLLPEELVARRLDFFQGEKVFRTLA